jgi:hypothetical protein
MMEYKLYTLVDVTHTGQFRNEQGRQKQFWQEQNFNTVIQTLNIRSNISYHYSPEVFEVGGRAVGFDTDDIIRVWRFDFSTQSDNIYATEEDPVGLLKEDFMAVPYIKGLDEAMQQEYAIFNTGLPGNNITFFKK